MDVTNLYVTVMEAIKIPLVVGGLVSLTVSIIVMLINMLIDAFCGRGLHVGLK
ncbi:MAG: hypothetical protein HFH86_01510 [Bacilli bacterium]|jgi:hypothetical protein|nr:hypothetical protein [Bacilli bacterium]